MTRVSCALLHCTALKRTTRCTALHAALHYTLHCNSLHCTMLHCTWLCVRCIAASSRHSAVLHVVPASSDVMIGCRTGRRQQPINYSLETGGNYALCVHCTQYSVHSTRISVQCTLYSVLCTLYMIQCTRPGRSPVIRPQLYNVNLQFEANGVAGVTAHIGQLRPQTVTGPLIGWCHCSQWTVEATHSYSTSQWSPGLANWWKSN